MSSPSSGMTQQLTPNLCNAHPQASITASALTAMHQFALFFSDGAGFGIEMVQALDAAHAQDIARAKHPTGRLSAVPAGLVEGPSHSPPPRGPPLLNCPHHGPGLTRWHQNSWRQTLT